MPRILFSEALHRATLSRKEPSLRKRLIVMAVGLAVAATAALPAAASGSRADRELTYEVTITNLNDNQWFTPPVVASHNRRADVFEAGEAASGPVQGLAENGDVPGLVEALSSLRRVHDVQVALSDAVPPLAPGASVTVEITASTKTRLLSVASMLICTNDGFTGVDSIRMPVRPGHTVTNYGYAYDAGTEINTEDFADIVPPCQELNGVSSDDPGTGETNPKLTERGVITMHPGITGGNDLSVDAHGWDVKAPVIAVAVTRTG
jgi:opacity protein-like surface antigen